MSSSLLTDVKFVDPIDFKYKCNFCKRRLSDPQQLKCGHRYCKPCIDQLLRERANGRCPACCEEDEQPGAATRDPNDVADGTLVQGNVFADNAIRREIGRLKCYCPNGKSCAWTGLYQNVEEHTKQCEYAIVNCRFKCGQQVTRNALTAHERDECQERPVDCDYCSETPKVKDKENHLQVCTAMPVTCSGCLEKMPRAQLAAHQDDTSGTCSRQYVACPYGCKDQLNKDNLDKHKERCITIHLDVVLAKFRTLDEQRPLPQPRQQQQRLGTVVEVDSGNEDSGCEEEGKVITGRGTREGGASGRGNGIRANGSGGRNLSDGGKGSGFGSGGIGIGGIGSGGIGGAGINGSDSSTIGSSRSDKLGGSTGSRTGASIAVAAASSISNSTGQPPRLPGSDFAQPSIKQQTERTMESLGDSGIGGSGGLPQAPASWPEVRSKMTVLTEDLVPNMFKAIEVLSYETKGCAAFVSEFKNYKRRQNEHTQLIEEKVKAIERRIQIKESRLVELTARQDMLEQIHYDGILLWRITDFARKRKDAISGKATQVTSHPFFTSPTGYKMCARAYLNGDASAKGTHLSVFFVLMKGPYDAILRWPFIQKVTVMLLDQNSSRHVKDSFQPDPTSQSFKRPTEMNVPVGCPQLCTLKDLENPNLGYLKEDTIFIKMIIEKTT